MGAHVDWIQLAEISYDSSLHERSPISVPNGELYLWRSVTNVTKMFQHFLSKPLANLPSIFLNFQIISQDQSGTPRKSVESAALRTCIRLFRNRSVLSTVNVNISRGELQTVQNLQTIKHWQLQHSNE